MSASSPSKPRTTPVLPQVSEAGSVVVVGGAVLDVLVVTVVLVEVVLVLVDVAVVVVVPDASGCSVRYIRNGHGPAAAPHGFGCAFWHVLPHGAVAQRESPGAPPQALGSTDPQLSPSSVVLNATQQPL